MGPASSWRYSSISLRVSRSIRSSYRPASSALDPAGRGVDTLAAAEGGAGTRPSRGVVFRPDGRSYRTLPEGSSSIVPHVDRGSRIGVRSRRWRAAARARRRRSSERAGTGSRSPRPACRRRSPCSTSSPPAARSGSPRSPASSVSRRARSTASATSSSSAAGPCAIDDGRFDLGIRALRLGSSSAELPDRDGVPDASRSSSSPGTTRRSRSRSSTAIESLFIAIEETSQPVRLVTHVGSKTPAFASASGRVVLASHPPPAVAAMFGGQAARHTDRPATERRRRAPVDPRRGSRARLRGEPRGDRRRSLRRLGPGRQRASGRRWLR